jgi:hypothetical protein
MKIIQDDIKQKLLYINGKDKRRHSNYDINAVLSIVCQQLIQLNLYLCH